MIQSIFLVLAAVMLCIAVTNAYADGESTIDSAKKDPSSAAQMDSRLPPVLPGEEIKTEGGTIKMWSTSGSPSQSEAQNPPSAPIPSSNIGIIIDKRHKDQNRHNESAPKSDFER